MIRYINPFKTFAILSFFMAFILLQSKGLYAQDRGDLSKSELEELQDENLNYLMQINEIVKDYPTFSYSYSMKDGKLDNVTVTGVDHEINRKRLEVVLFDLKSNRNKMKSSTNRMGVFYSVDKEASFEGGEKALENTLLSNIKYPEGAKDWGLEGTIYVRFVVDANGEIPFASTTSNIETAMDFYVEDLEEQAIKAIKATEGKWKPAEINNVEVASLSVLPITFNLKTNPSFPTMIK
ncbi:TonB protein C-terminal [Aquiflexum balticum DSM 16537]|uniref:TonB protein C-terminal n=1 Tax=Aquiflexum balticum DSM 16537 TaxID=758820 RepID=A0A1W2H8Y7_9BACT|nr:energy transducer TonB [Aquiflexum balticum]SMD45329.1 TonB protein C-terminal [Aquiflexum balticum DSM 16537]